MADRDPEKDRGQGHAGRRRLRGALRRRGGGRLPLPGRLPQAACPALRPALRLRREMLRVKAEAADDLDAWLRAASRSPDVDVTWEPPDDLL